MTKSKWFSSPRGGELKSGVSVRSVVLVSFSSPRGGELKSEFNDETSIYEMFSSPRGGELKLVKVSGVGNSSCFRPLAGVS